MPTHFSPEALKFLRGLARHNDREWFEPRRPIYERELKTPMLALIAEINDALAAFAPDHVRDPAKCMMRIYRDTRFSADKKPYKTQVAAWWSRAGLEKTSGGGFYFHINPTEVTIAAGCYMPGPEQLLAIRRHLIEHHAELRAILAGRKLRAHLTEFEGHRLKRPPRGFSADDPAVAAALDLLLCRQWGVSARLPADMALKPTLLKEIVSRFVLAAPVVAFLNAPLTPKKRPESGLFH
jgi:uncharacterized protein (TIGR02453 family)